MKKLSIRLPNELLTRIRCRARRGGVPIAEVVRQSLDTTLPMERQQAWMKYVGTLKDGPPDLSSRKGYSRK